MSTVTWLVVSVGSTVVLVVWGGWDLWYFWRKKDGKRDRTHLRDGIFLWLLAICDGVAAAHSASEVSSIKTTVSPRHLGDKRAKLVEGLRAASVECRVALHCYDTESCDLADELKGALKDAGCLPPTSTHHMDNPAPTGVEVHGAEQQCADAIVRAGSAAGFAMTAVSDSFEGGWVKLVVGGRPPP
jgi:hypothetical protein